MNVPRRTNVTKLPSTYIAEHEEKKQKAARRRRAVAVRLVVWSLLFAMFASALVYTLHSQEKAIDEKTAEQQKLKEQLAELERKEKQLKEEMKKLHDDDYIAELARKQYYLSKDGEMIFVLPEK
ncbi:septum formation initiator family protein [Geobacillus sp. BMUD]|uniref:FtsB family cell division protein n=1 Tax=Geobacillus TaxID=129337 RepID=UPI0004DFCB29|nr:MULTISPECIES: septum formation initiator family protein [Geobacillus]NNU85141.1 septum formation initiator family protein [Geobacillus sp. BMUD]